MDRRGRGGFGLGEVIVVLVIVMIVGLLLISAMPRQREAARMAACRKNLGEIGIALAHANKVQGHLPPVPPLGPDAPPPMSGPLALMMQTLGLPSFAGLVDPERLPANRPGAPTGPIRIPGFVCPSDGAGGLETTDKVSYRGTTGSTVDGNGGIFAPGREPLSLANVEAADGLGYTAAFSERLLGSGQDTAGLRNYAVVPGPVEPEGSSPLPPDAWRGDAGSSWMVANWPSTLYSHALPPNGSPSIVADDGLTARMGASSGHVEGVNVLRCDLSVTTVTTRVAPKVWKALADVGGVTDDSAAAVDDRLATQEAPRR